MRLAVRAVVYLGLACVGAFVLAPRALGARRRRLARPPRSAAAGKTMAELCDFYARRDAAATIFTDAKIDDAIMLWEFFLANLWRPAGHAVRVTVAVLGVRDRAAGVALVRHVFAAAQAHAAAAAAPAPLARVSLRVLASANAPEVAPRHEIDTYAPYASKAAGFVAAGDNEPLRFFQDEPPAPADLVAVMAQYFKFEGGPSSLAGLERLAPRRGGLLVFQAGFNTLVNDAAAEASVWSVLAAKVGGAGGKIVCVSNAYSFAGPKSERAMDVSHPFFERLRAQDGVLWGHLLDAGVKESFRFALDQMSKFFAGEFGECGGARARLGAELACDAGAPRARASAELAERFRADPAALTALCASVHAAVAEACGERRAEYLRRAVGALENYGRAIEITDGQHFACVMQREARVLWPCRAPANGSVEFTAEEGGVFWAARGVSGPQSFAWMAKLADVRTARACVMGSSAEP